MAVVLRKLFIFILLAIGRILVDGNFSAKELVNYVNINYVNYGTKILPHLVTQTMANGK